MLRDILNDHTPELQNIKRSNEPGDCHEVMLDTIDLFYEIGVPCQKLCIYVSDGSGDDGYLTSSHA